MRPYLICKWHYLFFTQINDKFPSSILTLYLYNAHKMYLEDASVVDLRTDKKKKKYGHSLAVRHDFPIPIILYSVK